MCVWLTSYGRDWEQRVDVPSKYASIENKLVTFNDGDKISTDCT